MVNLTPEFIAAREAELDRIIREATAEKDELVVIKRYAARFAGAPIEVSASNVEPQAPAPRIVQAVGTASGTSHAAAVGVAARRQTMPDALMIVLQTAQSPWMTARDIRAAVSSIMGRDVPMSSISPKLTDLKNNGVITRDEMKVALTSRVSLARSELTPLFGADDARL